jgi:hypothetical protein
MRATLVIIMATALLTGACAKSESPESSGDNCSAEAVAGSVDSFVLAYNEGAPDPAVRFFAGPDRFQWYSENPYRNNEAAFDLSTLDAYLASRHAAGHRLVIDGPYFVEYRAEDRTGHFTFVAEGAATIAGKGAIDCDTGKIMVWSF